MELDFHVLYKAQVLVDYIFNEFMNFVQNRPTQIYGFPTVQLSF